MSDAVPLYRNQQASQDRNMEEQSSKTRKQKLTDLKKLEDEKKKKKKEEKEEKKREKALPLQEKERKKKEEEDAAMHFQNVTIHVDGKSVEIKIQYQGSSVKLEKIIELAENEYRRAPDEHRYSGKFQAYIGDKPYDKETEIRPNQKIDLFPLVEL